MLPNQPVVNCGLPPTDPTMDTEGPILRNRHSVKEVNPASEETDKLIDPSLVTPEDDLDQPEDELNIATRAQNAAHNMAHSMIDQAQNMVDQAQNMVDQAEVAVKRLILAGWNVCHFSKLPEWLQDNDYLFHGHRPPLPSFRACFKSIFRVHTETGNIWTHLIGCLAFICIASYFLINPSLDIKLQDKLVFGIFFAGAIICLGFSFTFHTVSCHSQFVSKVFSKLDYCGISFLIMGSSVSWLYYGFYCHFQPKLIYLIGICTLGIATIGVSLLDKFSEPAWRPVRAGTFVTFGLSSVIPAIHYGFLEGWFNKVFQRSFGWLVLMGLLYLTGAMLYAVRIPERFYPGKFDIWLHSHQIFHVFVIGAALVHFHGVTELAIHRVTMGQCDMVDAMGY